MHRSRGNGNSITATFWMLADIIREASLLTRVRTILESNRIKTSTSELDFDYEKLFDDPLLQSIYAETLRLRVANYILRSPEHRNLNLNGWSIPRNSTMLVSGYHAQMDPKAWSNNDHQTRPVEEFWAERFLEFPRSEKEKPLESMALTGDPKGSIKESSDVQGAEFTLEGRTGHWLPYGGGQRTCPGRYFAKQEMISGVAVLLTMFDIEITSSTRDFPKLAMKGVGFGAIPPDRKLPIRMRRRVWE